jgi:hypothetical protein
MYLDKLALVNHYSRSPASLELKPSLDNRNVTHFQCGKEERGVRRNRNSDGSVPDCRQRGTENKYSFWEPRWEE